MIVFKENINSLEFIKDDAHIKVIRPKPGQLLKLTDFKGNIYNVEVLDYNFKTSQGSYKILNTINVKKPQTRTLIQSQIDKTYIEKLLEIAPLANITEIIIVNAQYSNSSKLNIDRLKSIIYRACEQCELPYLPTLTIENQDLISYIYKNSLRPTIMELPSKNSKSESTKSSTVVIGPEGGFSTKEIEFFNDQKLSFYSLKSNVLPSWIAGYSYFIE